MMTFESAWAYSTTIPGWYTTAEGKLLWDCAQGVRIACEVGSYRGRSTSLLAQTGALVHAIEPFLLAPGSPNDTPTSGGRYVSDEVRPVIFADFFRYLAQFHENVRLHAERTEDLLEGEIKNIGLLHIDGDHIDGVFRDIEILTPVLVPGGIAVFHDYEPIHTKFTRVKEAVDALEWEVVGHADSAIAVRKPL